MSLNDRKRFVGGYTRCPLCGALVENLEYLMLEYDRLWQVRVLVLQLRRPSEENRKDIIGRILFEYVVNDALLRQRLADIYGLRERLVREEEGRT